MKQLLLILFFTISIASFSQVSLVKDIQPGISSSAPNGLTVFNGELYFAATTNAEGIELWKSDGTTAGTILLKDINSGSAGSAPEDFTVTNNRLYFSSDNGINGREVWFTDGTLNGTLFIDAYQGVTGSNPSEFISAGSNLPLIFIAGHLFESTTDFGTEVFTINGNSFINSLTRITMDSSFGNPENLFYDNSIGKLYFSADNGVDGKELYSWDGLSFSEQMISNINSSGSSDPAYFVNFSGKIYFSATNGANGIELFELDPTNSNAVTMIKNINTTTTDSGNSRPNEKVIYNNKIYFAANDGTNGVELWESDGTTAGTQMVLNLNAGSADSNPTNFKLYNNRLYFTATNAALGREMFYVNGAGNVINVSNINPGSASSNPSELVEYNGKLYFIADDGTNGVELWETAGTSLSTVMTVDINTAGSSNPSGLVVLNDELFFSAFGNSSVSGFELWKYRDPSLSLNSNEISNFITLYPNPTNGGFVVDLNFPINKIDVYSLQGALVKTFSNEQSIYYIDNLRAGVYFLNIKTDKGTFIKKIIKN